MNSAYLPATPDEYIICFRQLAAITHSAMDFVENHKPIQLASLDRIAHNVETIACLRGDSGIYSASQPNGLAEAYQTEMYATENELRSRLLTLGYTYPAARPLSETI